MSDYDFDYFVIGGGSGGVRSARIAASHGAKVAIAEARYLGGTCVNVGCVPKKLFAYAAHYAHDLEDAQGYGWNIDGYTHDWPTLVRHKDSEIERLNGIYKKLLTTSGVTTFNGFASFVDEHTIEVNGKTYTAEEILIATGGTPNLPDHEGVEHAITSNEVFYLKDFPKHILIVGGGYISVEFACIFKALGANVSLYYRGDLFMRGFDDDLRHALREEMEKQGIKLVFNSPTIEKIEATSDRYCVTLDNEEKFETDCVFYAIGRSPETAPLNLKKAGIKTDDKGAIEIDCDYRTSTAHIYAVGDVTNRFNLTPVAIAEGHALADNLFKNDDRTISYTNIATAVFTLPPMATCGLTEVQAIEAYDCVKVFSTHFKPMKHTLSGRDEKVLMKLLVDGETDKIVGAHLIGEDTPEMMQTLSTVMNMGGTKADLDRTIPIHPISAEELVTMREPARIVGACKKVKRA